MKFENSFVLFFECFHLFDCFAYFQPCILLTFDFLDVSLWSEPGSFEWARSLGSLE